MSEKKTKTDSALEPTPPPATLPTLGAELWDKTKEMFGAVPEPPERALPGFLVAASIRGGTEVLGIEVDGEWIVPALFRSTGDLKVHRVRARADHELAPIHIIERLLEGLPRAPLVEPTDDDVVRELCIGYLDNTGTPTGGALVDSVAFADYLRSSPGVDEALLVRLALQFFEQSWGLDADRAVQVLELGWGAPYSLPKSRERYKARPLNIERRGENATHTWLLETARALRTPAESLYKGKHLQQVNAQVKAELVRQDEEKKSRATAIAEANALERTTPQQAGLLVVYRPAIAAPPLPGAPPSSTSLRNGIEIATFIRVWPGSIVPGTISHVGGYTGQNFAGGHAMGWSLMGDDDEVELSRFDIEHGRKMHAPRFILDAIVSDARTRVQEKRAIASFVDKSEPRELDRRMRIFNAFLDGPARIVFDLDRIDGYATPVYRQCVMQLGIVGLRIDPLLVANAIGKRAEQRTTWARYWRGANAEAIVERDAWALDARELITIGYQIANTPELHFMAHDAGVSR